MSSMLVDDNQDKKQSSKNDIQVANMMTTMFSKIGSNDLESLKSYIQSNQKQLKIIPMQSNILIMWHHKYIAIKIILIDKLILIKHLVH